MTDFDVNWEAFSHQDLYDMIHNRGDVANLGNAAGRGTAAVEGAQDSWSTLREAATQAHTGTNAALQQAGAGWQGGAADAMQSATSPLVAWAQGAQQASDATTQALTACREAFSDAQHQMPEPVRLVTMSPPDSLPAMVALQHDQAAQEAAAQAARQQAIDVMRTYTTRTQQAVSGFGSWTAPNPATVQVNVAPASTVPATTAPATGASPGRSAGVGSGPAATGAAGARGTTPAVGSRDPGQAVSVAGGAPAPTADPGTPASPTNPGDPAGPAPFVTSPGRPDDEPPVGAPGGTAALGDRSGPVRSGPVRSGAVRSGIGAEPVSGGRSGAGGLAEEPAERIAGGAAAAEEMPPGGPLGAGRGAREAGQDEERRHRSPKYLRDTHDDFWEGDRRVVPPPVIGE